MMCAGMHMYASPSAFCRGHPNATGTFIIAALGTRLAYTHIILLTRAAARS